MGAHRYILRIQDIGCDGHAADGKVPERDLVEFDHLDPPPRSLTRSCGFHSSRTWPSSTISIGQGHDLMEMANCDTAVRYGDGTGTACGEDRLKNSDKTP